MNENSLRIGLFYYSGTGSTAYLGKYIAEEFDKYGYKTSLHRITAESKENWDEFDIIGIGSPVWIWRSPKVLTNRLKDHPFQNKPYFIFITSGGSPGNAAWSIYKSVKNHNNIYMGKILGNGPNNIRRWRPSLKKSKTSEGNSIQLKYFEQASMKITNFHNDLVDTPKESWEFLKAAPPKRNLIWSLISVIASYRWQLQAFVGKKDVIKEKCTNCELCVTEICPSGAITLSDEKFPIFNEKLCVGCMGCINLCPTIAIETRSSKNKQPFTKYRKYIIKKPKSLN